MKLYLDKSLTKEVPIVIDESTGKSKYKLNLDIVEAGQSKEYTYFLHNDHEYGEIRDLKLVVDNKEVEVTRCPSSVSINESVEIGLRWNADKTIERGIHPNFKLTYNLICS